MKLDETKYKINKENEAQKTKGRESNDNCLKLLWN